MVIVTAVESLAKSFAFMRATLSESTYWQAMQLAPDATYEELLAIITDGTQIGATSKQMGLDKIIGDTLAELTGDYQDSCDVSVELPRIICRYSPEFRIARASTTTHETTASFDLTVEIPVPSKYRRRNAECLLNQTIDHYNKIGAMVRQWKEAVVSGSAGMLQVDSWDVSAIGLVLPEQSGNEADGWMRNADIVATFTGIC